MLPNGVSPAISAIDLCADIQQFLGALFRISPKPGPKIDLLADKFERPSVPPNEVLEIPPGC